MTLNPVVRVDIFTFVVRGTHCWYSVEITGWPNNVTGLQCECERSYFKQLECVHVTSVLKFITTECPDLPHIDRTKILIG